MQAFRKSSFSRSVMFAVGFDDGRTAYLVIDNHGSADQDYRVAAVARERQARGELPDGTITTVKRVR
jgi:hypothetical protein